MAFITNSDYDNSVIYNDKKFSETQMISDSSSMSTEEEEMFKAFARQSQEYAKKVAKKKFYDFKTKNRSFLELYQDLYRLGVKNNKFFLRLYDTDLQGVDVYSPVMPKDLQIKIFIECLINPWYFLREVLRIPVDGMPIEIGGGVPYKIDRSNLSCWYLFLNGIDHYQSKPRQRGKTQDCVAKFNYAYHFGNMSSTILFFNKDQDQANINLYRLKCQRDMLPAWLQMRAIIMDNGKADKGIDNTKSIRNPVNGNTIMTMGKATSKESAMKLGRGSTAALQYLDEFDFIPYQTEIMNAASFAYSTAASNAEKNGSLYGRILSSTPGDLDTRDGANATEFVSRMLRWDDSMYDKPIEQIKKIVNGPSYNRFVYSEFTWQQLKLPMSWYETQCGLVSFNAEVIMREIDLKRIHGSSNSPFKRSDLLYIMNHQLRAIQKVDYSKNLCSINIYEKIKLNKVYILAIDPSEGLAQNNNAFSLINPSTQKIAAEFKSPYISQPDLCRLCCKFLDEYCPKSMIIVENNKGRELINCFLETKYRYQMYYDDGKLTDKVIEKTDPYGALKRESIQRRAYGIWTSNTNRVQYYAILENIMEERKELLLTPYIVEDVCGLIRKPNGKVEAGPGACDDNIMSYLIGMFVYLHSPYEKLEQYGIRRGASDDLSDYDENGEITEEGTLRKLQELLPSLPDTMREIISNTLQQKDPIVEAESYYKEIQKYKLDQLEMDSMRTNTPNQDFIQSAGPADTAFWSQYDNGVWESNYQSDNHDTLFNIEDYI